MKTILLTGMMLLACLGLWRANAQENNQVNLVFIGNSITYGAGLENPVREAPPVRTAIYLGKQPFIGTVRYSNQGVSGSTTVDFLPEKDLLYPKVVAAADQFADEDWATLVFSIMLGTNDSAEKGPNGSPVSPEQYRRNMQTIIDSLLDRYTGSIVVVHRPLWYSPTTHNASVYLKAGLERLESYYPVLQAMIEEYEKTRPGRVFLGDTEGFDYFRKHYQEAFQAEAGNSGTFYLHPNRDGAETLGQFWGKALYKVLIH